MKPHHCVGVFRRIPLLQGLCNLSLCLHTTAGMSCMIILSVKRFPFWSCTVYGKASFFPAVSLLLLGNKALFELEGQFTCSFFSLVLRRRLQCRRVMALISRLRLEILRHSIFPRDRWVAQITARPARVTMLECKPVGRRTAESCSQRCDMMFDYAAIYRS